MKPVGLLTILLVLAPALAREALAAPSIPRLPATEFAVDPLIKVQQDDTPEVVRLLAQRAVRAERRGDMATANVLYALIREMGYRVQRPGAQAPTRGEPELNERGGGLFGGNRLFGGGRASGDDDDDDDDDGWDGDDDGDDGDRGGDDDGDDDDD